MITNDLITTKENDFGERIFGPDIGTIKGKTSRRKPIPVVDDMVDIPSESVQVQEDVILTLDGMTVNSLKFLTTISKHIYYRTTHYMPSTMAESYRAAIEDVINVYRMGGFQVVEIHCDNEFRATMDPIETIQSPPICMNYSNPQEHVPEAERNNRVIKERVHACYHCLPMYIFQEH